MCSPSEETSKVEKGLLGRPRGRGHDKYVRRSPMSLAPLLVNGWIVDPNNPACYYRDELGFVRMFGAIQAGTVTADSLVWTFPVGFRPMASVPASGGGRAQFMLPGSTDWRGIYIPNNGDAKLIFNVQTAVILPLDGIFFPAFVRGGMAG
jgi:hypothetical protein